MSVSLRWSIPSMHRPLLSELLAVGANGLLCTRFCFKYIFKYDHEPDTVLASLLDRNLAPKMAGDLKIAESDASRRASSPTYHTHLLVDCTPCNSLCSAVTAMTQIRAGPRQAQHQRKEAVSWLPYRTHRNTWVSPMPQLCFHLHVPFTSSPFQC